MEHSNMSNEAKKTVRINNWKIIDGQVPGIKVLTGDAVDHPRYGTANVITSAIIHDRAPTYVETRNHLYLLGEPATIGSDRRQAAVEVVARVMVADLVNGPAGELLTLIFDSPESVLRGAREQAKQFVDALIADGFISE
jgi:hypothetical protein